MLTWGAFLKGVIGFGLIAYDVQTITINLTLRDEKKGEKNTITGVLKKSLCDDISLQSALLILF